MTQEQKDTLNKYAEIKKEIKALEAKADLLNPQVLEVMRKQEAEEVTIGELGKLSIGSRRTWKYSKDIEDSQKYLKEKMKIEEQTGKADYVEKHYVIFTANKGEE